MKDMLLWMDFETTGLDVNFVSILEVGWMVTDDDLNVLAPVESRIVANNDWEVRSKMDEYVREMHTKSELLEALSSSKSHLLVDIETEILDALNLVVKRLGVPDKVVLAGSGVAAYDMQLIRSRMPRLAHRLTYWSFDVSNFRRLGNLFGMDLPSSATDEPLHRAAPDILDAWTLARTYKEIIAEMRKGAHG
jgi:oligoribonuclease (3'-5' exoribonuclease)